MATKPNDPKTAENYHSRVSEGRKEVFTVITTEEDIEIARRTGRARKVERCPRCGRDYRIATGCWFCRNA